MGSINNYIKEREFKDLKACQEERVFFVIRNGIEEKINENDILVGDLLKIAEGMTMPADGILVQGFNVAMDEAAMTGEVDLIDKGNIQECISQKKQFLLKYPDFKKDNSSHHKVRSPVLSSGTLVHSGTGVVIIIAVGVNSESGKIKATIDANKANEDQTPLQKKLDNIATFVGKVI